MWDKIKSRSTKSRRLNKKSVMDCWADVFTQKRKKNRLPQKVVTMYNCRILQVIKVLQMDNKCPHKLWAINVKKIKTANRNNYLYFSEGFIHIFFFFFF